MDPKSNAEASMKTRIENLYAELSSVRTGRANPQILDGIKVEYYGQEVPIKQVAAVSVVEGRNLEIRPWDATVMEALEKALQKSDIGVPPQSDGKIIRLQFPAMTEDRRKEMAKLVGKIGEEFRVSIRQDRREAIDAIRKNAKETNLSEDQLKGMEGAIQKITDTYIGKVDETIDAKQKEITTV